MRGKIKGDKVVLGQDAVEELYSSLYYGRLKGDTLELALVEAAYLLDREKIKVEYEGKELGFREFFERSSGIQEYFELKYIVYRDLRERGFYVQPSVTDFRIYPRGGKPNVTPSQYFLHVVTERKPLPMQHLITNLQAAVNVRKEMILAIVDEESDITYYGVKFMNLKGGMGRLDIAPKHNTATFLEDRVIVWDTELSLNLHNAGFYGNMLDDKRLQLSLVETAYLISKGNIEVIDSSDGKPMELDAFIDKALRIEDWFEGKLKVYADLRDRGLVVKTGFKFGSHFRAYEKVETLEKLPHSKYLIDALAPGHVFELQDMSRSIRLANSVRKEMVFAYDKNDSVQYFSPGRIKL
jgi:tRNA-intron endonuclease